LSEDEKESEFKSEVDLVEGDLEEGDFEKASAFGWAYVLGYLAFDALIHKDDRSKMTKTALNFRISLTSRRNVEQILIYVHL